MSNEDIENQFGIPADLDYIEWNQTNKLIKFVKFRIFEPLYLFSLHLKYIKTWVRIVSWFPVAYFFDKLIYKSKFFNNQSARIVWLRWQSNKLN